MTAAIAVLGSVAMVCASALVAWRWWLAHQAATEAAGAKRYERELADLADVKQRLKALEYKR